MPPQAFLEPSSVSFDQLVADREQIAAVLPQRHEFALLDGVVFIDTEAKLFVGYHDVKPDAWWTRAHIPGRPLFPGVLMIEVAAQLAAWVSSHVLHDSRFIGFAGLDDVKFRGAVVPPCRLLMIARAIEIRPRRIVCAAQGFVDSTMVFEGSITGMPV